MGWSVRLITRQAGPTSLPPRVYLDSSENAFNEYLHSGMHMYVKTKDTEFGSIQFIHLRPTLCNPMDCSTPGFPVHHQLPELAQTPVHEVSDAIQPSHPLSSPSPPAFNLS